MSQFGLHFHEVSTSLHQPPCANGLGSGYTRNLGTASRQPQPQSLLSEHITSLTGYLLGFQQKPPGVSVSGRPSGALRARSPTGQDRDVRRLRVLRAVTELPGEGK